MRKKKGTDQIGDTATNLGEAMDELMRHQPSLRASVLAALVKVLYTCTCMCVYIMNVQVDSIHVHVSMYVSYMC